MTRKPGGQNNAVKHGAFARDLILDDESADEFGLLWNGLFEEWAPDGTLEEETVVDLAHCIWTKRRSDRFFYDELRGAQEHPDEAQISSLHIVAKILDGVQTLDDAEATAAVAKILFPKLYLSWVEEECPRSKFNDVKSWIKSLRLGIPHFAAWHEMFIDEHIKSRAFKAKTAARVREITAQKIALDERLDARIDKAIKRLAQLKTFKQIVKEQASHAKSIDHHRISDQRVRQARS